MSKNCKWTTAGGSKMMQPTSIGGGGAPVFTKDASNDVIEVVIYTYNH